MTGTTTPATPPIDSIAIFCGSSFGNDPKFVHLAEDLGRHLAESNVRIVFGGSDSGLMGTVADAAITAGGNVMGIYPEKVFAKDVKHPAVTDLILVSSMHERKVEMFRSADAAIALPGGLGTLDELVELLLWTQLGIHNLPLVLLDTGTFWGQLVDLLENLSQQGFLKPARGIIWDIAEDPEQALTTLKQMSVS